MSHSENMKRFQEMLDEGAHCSQCVFSYWAERLGIDDEFANGRCRLASCWCFVRD